jgi:predicted acetyltransferase
MGFEIRTITTEEMAEAGAISAYAFGSDRRHDPERMAEAADKARERYSPDWYLGAFEASEMTAMMRIIPSEMHINGGRIGFGAVSPVASLPQHRRKGHSGGMLRRSLEVMRERSQALSGLYTPHPAFYRRYGWEIAADLRRYSFKPKDLELQKAPLQRGAFRMLKPDAWPEIESLYQAHASRHNGPLARSKDWWRDYVVEVPWRGIADIVLWQDDSGRPQGYGLYLLPTSGPDVNKVIVMELVALTGDAYLNLLAYFARHDINSEIVIYGASHDALPLLFADAERLEIKQEFSVMLRIVDFEAAMTSRPAARSDEACEIVLRIEDRDAPWNDGVWRAGIVEGKTWVERTTDEPEINLSARMLAPLFNGYIAPSRANQAGLVPDAPADALARADQVFATVEPPFFLDHF